MDAFKVRFFCARGRRTLMADIVSPEKRSQNMSAIRSKDTKPEVYLRKLLFAQGYRYRIADKSVPGHPDIFLRKYNTAIFVNGCFWHRHPDCKYAYTPKSRVEFWQKKFDDNVQRDAVVKAVRNKEVLYKEISKYPAVSRDLALLLDKNVEFEAIENVARQTEKKLLKKVELFDVYEGKNLPAGKKSYAVNFILQDETKTLNDKQIDAMMNKLIANLKSKLGAELR